MASKEDYLKFMSEVRKVSGVDTLTPDETGLVSIRVDDAYNVNLQFVEATGKILCFVEVTALPPDAAKDVEEFVHTIEKILQLCDIWAERIRRDLSGEEAEGVSNGGTEQPAHFLGSMIRA